MVVWYSYLFKNFPQFVVIHTKALVLLMMQKFFPEFPYFFCNPEDVGNLVSGSSAFSKSSWCICKFLVHILLKPNLKDFEHYLASM